MHARLLNRGRCSEITMSWTGAAVRPCYSRDINLQDVGTQEGKKRGGNREARVKVLDDRSMKAQVLKSLIIKQMGGSARNERRNTKGTGAWFISISFRGIHFAGHKRITFFAGYFTLTPIICRRIG